MGQDSLPEVQPQAQTSGIAGVVRLPPGITAAALQPFPVGAAPDDAKLKRIKTAKLKRIKTAKLQVQVSWTGGGSGLRSRDHLSEQITIGRGGRAVSAFPAGYQISEVRSRNRSASNPSLYIPT